MIKFKIRNVIFSNKYIYIYKLFVYTLYTLELKLLAYFKRTGSKTTNNFLETNITAHNFIKKFESNSFEHSSHDSFTQYFQYM